MSDRLLLIGGPHDGQYVHALRHRKVLQMATPFPPFRLIPTEELTASTCTTETYVLEALRCLDHIIEYYRHESVSNLSALHLLFSNYKSPGHD